MQDWCFLPSMIEIGQVILEKSSFLKSSMCFQYYNNLLLLRGPQFNYMYVTIRSFLVKGFVFYLNKNLSFTPKNAS